MTADDVERIASAVADRVAGGEREPYYTVDSLAAKFSLSRRTVRDMLARGAIASYKIEGARRVRPQDVDQYLAERRQRKAT